MINFLKKLIRYKKSVFFCDGCNMVVSGEGYMIPSKNQAFCKRHYQEAINKEFKK